MGSSLLVWRHTFCLFLLISGNSLAQNISAKKWKNRILIVETSSLQNDKYIAQLEEFNGLANAFQERKLILYLMHDNTYTLFTFNEDVNSEQWREITNTKGFIVSPETSFKISLIGLDGGIKRTQNKILTKEELFLEIDSMPMRMRERRF
ncbi:hypothetical protein BSU00_01370 [Tenacibaculum sp. SG-28]|nr:hypothetical protein BSU00_01370 [Tenacibaculum sp. SG-28]